jgi:type I restriction enzyme S subunit
MCAISGKTEEELAQLSHETLQQLKTTAALFPDALVDSELGEIPEGWEVKPFSQMIEIIGGGTPKRSEESFWNGSIPWFSVKDAPAEGNVFVVNTAEKITEDGLSKSSTKLLPEGTTIISARGTVGKLALVGIPMAMNQSCYGIKGSADIGDCLNYLNLKYMVEALKQNTHGAVFDTITKDTFKTIELIDTNRQLKRSFENIVTPLFKKIKNNLLEINELSSLRDTLLPKLLSGELALDEVNPC